MSCFISADVIKDCDVGHYYSQKWVLHVYETLSLWVMVSNIIMMPFDVFLYKIGIHWFGAMLWASWFSMLLLPKVGTETPGVWVLATDIIMSVNIFPIWNGYRIGLDQYYWSSWCLALRFHQCVLYEMGIILVWNNTIGHHDIWLCYSYKTHWWNP